MISIWLTLPRRVLSGYSKLSPQPQRVNSSSLFGKSILTTCPDREEALKDDYPLEGEYDDDDEEDEWAGDDTTWNGEETEEEPDVKDESSAYLEFLNEEVSQDLPLWVWLANQS